MAEILLVLRERLDKEMRGLFGQIWLAEQAPEPVRRRLAERNEREDAVAFSEGARRELIDYADFGDIGEVLQGAGPGILDGVFAQRQVLQSRLLELQVVQLKLSLALSLDDQDVALLSTLHGRLGLAQSAAPQVVVTPPLTAPTTAPPHPAPHRTERPVANSPAPAPAPPAPAPQVAAAVTAPEAPPARPAARIDAPSYEEFMQALGRGATGVIIRSLYSEIMAAVSDFYAILEEVPKTLGSSPTRDKLAEHLNRRGFAQCLTALREVFQKHLK